LCVHETIVKHKESNRGIIFFILIGKSAKLCQTTYQKGILSVEQHSFNIHFFTFIGHNMAMRPKRRKFTPVV
jgi:hypothetical protein